MALKDATTSVMFVIASKIVLHYCFNPTGLSNTWFFIKFQLEVAVSKKLYDSSGGDDAIVGWKSYGVILLQK